MTRRGVSWVSIALLALVMAGCGASADASDGHSAATSSSTTVVPTTTTTVPPPYSFDGSVPPPKLINTGTDYEAIIRSLDAYSHWLLAHAPESEQLPQILSLGTPTFVSAERDLKKLRTHNYRLYDSASNIVGVDVLSEASALVALRVQYTDELRTVVDANGSTIDSKSLPPTSRWSYVLAADTNGRWRIAAADPITQ